MQKSEGRALDEGVQRAVSIGWGEEDQVEVSEAFTWFHVPAVGFLDVVVLSVDPVLYRGHFMGRAVQPCSIPRCVHCQNGVGVLKRCAISVYSFSLGARGLLELGERTTGEIRALSGAAGHLRGLAVRFSKEHERDRGRILAIAYPGSLEVVTLPEEQDPLVPLNAQWSKLSQLRRTKDGSANIRHVGEADLSSTQKPGEAVLSVPDPDAPKTIAEAQEWLRSKQA